MQGLDTNHSLSLGSNDRRDASMTFGTVIFKHLLFATYPCLTFQVCIACLLAEQSHCRAMRQVGRAVGIMVKPWVNSAAQGSHIAIAEAALKSARVISDCNLDIFNERTSHSSCQCSMRIQRNNAHLDIGNTPPLLGTGFGMRMTPLPSPGHLVGRQHV